MSYYANQEARGFLRDVREAYRITRAGGRITIGRLGDPLDLEGFRAWFRDTIDGRINHKSGCRSDGASPRPQKGCHCRGCTCVWGHGYHHIPFGGRNWEEDQQRRFERDTRAARDVVSRRLRVRRFETRVARGRLDHLQSDED